MLKSKLSYILFFITIILLIVFPSDSGMVGLLIGGIVILIFFYFFYKDVTFAYILCIFIIADPFVLITWSSFGFPSNLDFRSFFFYLAFLVVFSPQVTEKRVDYRLKAMLSLLFLFTLYQFIVSYLLKVAPDNFKAIFMKSYRFYEWYLGIYLIIPSYLIFKLDGKKFINTLLLASITYSGAALINVYTPIYIWWVPFEYRNGILRLFISSCQLMKFTIFLAMAAYMASRNKKTYFHYYLSGIMTLTLIIIGQYRLELMTTFLTVLLIIFIVSKFITKSLAGFFKFVKIGIILVVLLSILLPSVYRGLSELYIKTFQEVSGSSGVQEGTTQSRTIIELPNQLEVINNHPITGAGWIDGWFTNFTNKNDLGLTDIPFTGTLAMYGLLGMLIYYFRFIFILPPSKQFLNAVGNDPSKMDGNEFYYILLISLRAYFIMMITFRFFYIGFELAIPRMYSETGIFLGIYFATLSILERQNERQ